MVKSISIYKLLVPGLLFLITFNIYYLSHTGDVAHLDYFVPLAESFLQGKLYLESNPAWLNELVNFGGHFYVVYPPMPAVILVPFVAIFGSGVYQPLISILIASINVALAFLVFQKITNNKRIYLLVSILYAFGSMQWFHAQAGSAWYFAHIVAMFFIWLALLESFTKQRLFLIGLLIGAAYLSRLPAILAVFFVFTYFHEKFISFHQTGFKIHYKSYLLFGLGLLPGLLLNALYNYLRFGVLYDKAYDLLPLLQEPWYNHGFLSIYYLPLRLKEMFFALPIFSADPPYIKPSLYALALWVVTPAFLLIPFAKYKNIINISAIIAAIAISIPSLTKGGNGFTQFGFRYALDFVPFLMLLTLSAMERVPRWLVILLIVLSIIINIWGIIMINFLKIWGW